MKKYIICSICLFCVFTLWGTEVSSRYAIEIGESFLQNILNECPQTMQYSAYSSAECTQYNRFPNLYFITTYNGWVIVSSDTRVQPILAYSVATDSLDIGNVPDALHYLLQDYNQSIQYVKDSVPDNDTYTHPQWEQIRLNSLTTENVAVLLKRCTQVLWNQDCNNDNHCSPAYNQLCPTFYTPRCGHTYAGCTAVAMAQIMWYYQWPYSAYVPNSISPEGVPSDAKHDQWYDWEIMPPALYSTTSQKAATMVATLLRDCGYAAKMTYRANGSGARLADARDALVNTFGYSPDIKFRKKSLTINWNKRLREEIDADRPVLYAGWDKNGEGGHAFVVDGYQGDYFHINWGWGDAVANNAYYTLDILQPIGKQEQYADTQQALFGIVPDPLCEPSKMCGVMESSFLQVTGGSITLSPVTIMSSADCRFYSGTEVQLSDRFVAQKGCNLHIAIKDIPCNVVKRKRSHEDETDHSQEDAYSEIENTISDVGFIVTPNPVTDMLHVSSLDEILSIVVYSSMGQLVLHTTETNIDVSSLTAGAYVLHAQTNMGQWQRIFIKQ